MRKEMIMEVIEAPIDACAGEMRVMFSDPFNLGLLKIIDKVPREESRGQDIDYVL